MVDAVRFRSVSQAQQLDEAAYGERTPLRLAQLELDAGGDVESVPGVDVLHFRSRSTKVPRLPLQVVTQFTISTRCPRA
jgi:hypothetical protein